MHWKNNTISIPRTKVLSTYRRARKWECLGRTVEDRAYDDSREVGLFRIVQIMCELRSVTVIGPHVLLSVRHGSDVYKGGRILAGRGIGRGEEGVPG